MWSGRCISNLFATNSCLTFQKQVRSPHYKNCSDQTVSWDKTATDWKNVEAKTIPNENNLKFR